jgi:hypothetical protein
MAGLLRQQVQNDELQVAGSENAFTSATAAKRKIRPNARVMRMFTMPESMVSALSAGVAKETHESLLGLFKMFTRYIV